MHNRPARPSRFRLRQRLQFVVERLLLRGTRWRLAFMAAGVIAVAVAGGVLLMLLGEPEKPGAAVWWAFLRLTDPGYLGDDQGTGRRVVSTALTVAGYVLFMGALIAILTQWLQETVKRLQLGETPVVMDNHIVVLGLTEHTPIVVAEMLRSESTVLRRILRRRGAARLRVVVLVDGLDETIRASLVERLGPAWDDTQIILRNGSSLVEEHLERCSIGTAAAILVPNDEDMTDASLRDAAALKTVLSVLVHPDVAAADPPPRLVAELRDPRLAAILDQQYPGALELLPSDAVIGRILAQTIRHQGLSWVLGEMLSFQSTADIYYRELEDAAGLTFGEVAARMEGGIALGFLRRAGHTWTSFLNASPSEVLAPGDRCAVLGRRFDDIRLGPPTSPLPQPDRSLPVVTTPTRRVLLLGWSPRVVPLLSELDTYVRERFTVDHMSRSTPAARAERLAAAGVELQRVHVRHLVGDYTNPVQVVGLDLTQYDNIIVFGPGEAEPELSDARALAGALIVHSQIADLDQRPSLVVELMDADNVRMLERRPGEVVLSPQLMGHLLAHVAVRPELHAVVDDLFTVGGAEVHFRPPAELGLAGEQSFASIRKAATAHREIALGVRTSSTPLDVSGDVELAPAADRIFHLGVGTYVVVLSTDHGAETALPAREDDEATGTPC